MPTVIAYLEVDDQLASTNREKLFGPLGVTGIREFVEPRPAEPLPTPDQEPVNHA
jgi:hypothetical protein